MTRANLQHPLYHSDPEIERIRRELRQGIRRIMANRQNNGQNPVEGQNPPAPTIRQEQPAPTAGLLIPPGQLNNLQQPVQTVSDYLVEDLDGLNPAITIPEFEVEDFKLKHVLFNMLNTLGQFGGSPAENARQHLKSFLEICNSFKIHGVSNDVLKLKLFPYSLRDKAKAWLNNLPPSSSQSWTELCRSFLAKFSYNNMIDKLRNEITSFMQEDDKAMHEAWERYRDLFRRCPMHGLPEWTQVSIFYNSVNTPTRMKLDASANSTLLDKPPREGLEIQEKLAQNDYQHLTSRRGTMRRGAAQLDSSDTILAQISTLTNMVKNMQKQPAIQEVKVMESFFKICGNNHDSSESSKLLMAKPEQHPKPQHLKSIGIPEPTKAESTTEPAKAGLSAANNYRTLENTLNAFMTQTFAYMARTDQFIQKTDAFMDKTKMRMQNQEATLKSL
ncbi:hypothetical protein V6N13_092755 [Hibiscus sabdariffa]